MLLPQHNSRACKLEHMETSVLILGSSFIPLDCPFLTLLRVYFLGQKGNNLIILHKCPLSSFLNVLLQPCSVLLVEQEEGIPLWTAGQLQHVYCAGEMAKASEPYEVISNGLLWEHAAKYPAHKQLVTATLADVASELGYAKLHDYCSYHMLCALDSWQGSPHQRHSGTPS